MPPPLSKIEERINAISAKLSAVETERASLTAELQSLKHTLAAEKLVEEKSKHDFVLPSFHITEENIKLFASLFKGRDDVLPKRWDNQKTGKSGYSPACNNEWVKGVCNKPQIKCTDCTNQ